jgi:hypothetical protein
MRMHPIFLTALLIASPASAQTAEADVRDEQTRREYPVTGSLTEGGHLRPGALP